MASASASRLPDDRRPARNPHGVPSGRRADSGPHRSGRPSCRAGQRVTIPKCAQERNANCLGSRTLLEWPQRDLPADPRLNPPCCRISYPVRWSGGFPVKGKADAALLLVGAVQGVSPFMGSRRHNRNCVGFTYPSHRQVGSRRQARDSGRISLGGSFVRSADAVHRPRRHGPLAHPPRARIQANRCAEESDRQGE